MALRTWKNQEIAASTHPVYTPHRKATEAIGTLKYTRSVELMKGRKPSAGAYTDAHAQSGITTPLPELETWPNQYAGYEITIKIPEYTAICPKTELPDFGIITIHYMPHKTCVELKSLKVYIHAYRNIGIFYENAVNRILQDLVKACKPKWATVTGIFTARGGLSSTILAKYPK